MKTNMQEPIIMTIPIPKGIIVKQTDTEITISGPPLKMVMLRVEIEIALLQLESETGTKRNLLNIQHHFVEETAL